MLADIHDLKNIVTRLLWLHPDALHLHFGLLLFWLGLLFGRGGRVAGWSIAVLVALCLVNEVADLTVKGLRSWPGSVRDIFNTLFWPIVLGWTISRLIRRPDRTG